MLEWIRMPRHREIVGHYYARPTSPLLFAPFPRACGRRQMGATISAWCGLINHTSTDHGTRQMDSNPFSRREISFIQWLLGVFSVHTEP
jgi:hypothetical protein